MASYQQGNEQYWQEKTLATGADPLDANRRTSLAHSPHSSTALDSVAEYLGTEWTGRKREIKYGFNLNWHYLYFHNTNDQFRNFYNGDELG